MEVFDPPQRIPLLDDVVLFAINHHIKGCTAGQMPVDGSGCPANRIGLTKKRLEIGVYLDREAEPGTEHGNEQTGDDDAAPVADVGSGHPL